MAERDGIARGMVDFMPDRRYLFVATGRQLPFEHGFDSATPRRIGCDKELMRP